MIQPLAWVQRIGPGFLILIAGLSLGVAFILQVLVSVGLPEIRGIYFLTFSLQDLGQEIKIGLWTICTRQYLVGFFGTDDGETCQGTSLGYQDPQYAPVATALLVPGLSKALAMQPLSTALTGLAVGAVGLHLCSNWIVWPFLCALAAVASILAFVFEIVLFSTARVRLNRNAVATFGSTIRSSAFGAGIWLQVAAMAVVCFATFLDWTAFTRRKLGKTHGGRFGKKTPSIYRASVAGSTSSRQGSKSALYDRGATPSSTRADSKRGFYDDPKEESYEMKAKGPAPASAAAATPAATDATHTMPDRTPALKTYSKQRKSVPSYDEQGVPAVSKSEGKGGTSGKNDAAAGVVGADEELNAGRGRRKSSQTQRRMSESDNEEGLFEDATEDGIPAAVSMESFQRYNEPMDPSDDTVISPTKGSRAARYSARMAELGLD